MMRSAILGFLVLFAGLFVSGQGQSSQSQQGPGKARMNDVPTPGVLGPLRTEVPEPPAFDTEGVPVLSFDNLEVDPVTGAHYRRGELLVRFNLRVDSVARAQALSRGGASRVVRTLPGNWELVGLEPDVATIGSAETLRQSAAIDQVALNYILTTQQVQPNDENYGLQWNFDAIGLPRAWEINPGGRNDVVVAVIDTGLNTLNETFVFSSPIVGQVAVRFSVVPDLVAEGRTQNAYDFVYDDEFPVDLGGHGTHVAGTIAQQTNNNIGVAGVAFNVKLMPLKVISGGSFISWDDIFFPGNPGGTAAIIAEAIRYAADNNAKIINLSLGGTGPIPSVRAAIEYAVGRGVFVAIAAGNSGDEGNPTMYPAAYGAQISGAMTVGAVNRNLRRASYSGFQAYVEVCAPGGETQSAVDYRGSRTPCCAVRRRRRRFREVLGALAVCDRR